MAAVTQSGGDEAPAYLDGIQAIEWFTRKRGRGETFDTHLTAINQFFWGGRADKRSGCHGSSKWFSEYTYYRSRRIGNEQGRSMVKND